MKRFKVELVADGSDELTSAKVSSAVEAAIIEVGLDPVAMTVEGNTLKEAGSETHTPGGAVIEGLG